MGILQCHVDLMSEWECGLIADYAPSSVALLILFNFPLKLDAQALCNMTRVA